MDEPTANDHQESLRQNGKPKNINAFFPQDTSAAEINKVVLKILKERQETAAKKEQTESCEAEEKQHHAGPPDNKNNTKPKKKDHHKPDKTCSFCKQKGHQRRVCPRKLYPGLNIDT